LSAFLIVGTTIGAEIGEGVEYFARQPPTTVSASGGTRTKLEGEPHPQRLTFGLDAALYGQWASETLTGANKLATLTWQFAGSWQLRRLERWGTSSLGWTFVGSRSIGDGPSDETMSGNVGSISGLNANVVPNAAAVDELFWRHASADRRWTLLVGRVDQAGHFDANRVANDGYSQFLAFAFENNPSIPWPTYGGFGGLLRLDLGADRYLLASVAAAGNEDPRIPWSTGGHEGWNQMLELGGAYSLPGLGRGHLRLTPWHSRIPGAAGFGLALNLDQELGSPIRADRTSPERRAHTRSIGFVRAGVGEPAVTPVQSFVSAGIALEQPFGRPRDEMALGVAWSRPSPGVGQRNETLIEAYYRFALSPALSLTPDVQVVIDPTLNPAARDSVVLGLRLHLSL